MSVAAPNKSYLNFNGYHIIPVPHHQMIPKSHLLLVTPTRFTPWTEEQALVADLVLTHLSQLLSNQSSSLSSLVTSISARRMLILSRIILRRLHLVDGGDLHLTQGYRTNALVSSIPHEVDVNMSNVHGQLST